MRYHFIKPEIYLTKYGKTYQCNHPAYTYCTLYLIGNKGLAVIQQRFIKENKSTIWTEIDPWLNDILYFSDNFIQYFNKYAGERIDGIYPTVTIRQIMRALKIKPLKREIWETCFDHCPI